MIKNKPNFLGIGSVRGGSTWLWTIINSYPDFYMPNKRKEILIDRSLNLWTTDFK